MKLGITKIITVSVVFGAALEAHGQESPWSINLTGFSWHENEKHRNEANQVNPGIGIRYDFSRSWYGEVNHVSRNSLQGTTDAVGVGFHTEATPVLERPVLLGAQIMWMHYRSPGKDTVVGIVPALMGEYRMNNKMSLVVYIFPKMNESVVFAGINVRF